MINRPKQEHEYDQRQEALIATIAQQEDYVWKDSVVDTASLPMTGNTVDDIRKVLSDGYVRRWDGTNWIMMLGSGGSGGTSLQQWDASGGVFPATTPGQGATWIISGAGTLPAPIGAVDLGDYLLWDGYNWTVIPNNADIYVNPGVNNVAVGGLGANSGPFNDTVRGMLDRFLYPFIDMSASLATSPSYGSYYEKGVNIAPVNLTANFTNSQNPRHPVTDIECKRGTTTIDTMTGVDITSPQVFSETDPVDDTTTFSVEVTDDQPVTKISSRTIRFVYPMYGGHSVADDYLNWTDLASIEAVLATKRVRPEENTAITDTFTNERNIFMYPATYGTLSSIIDGNGFNTISDYDMFTRSYTARDGSSVSYHIYQLKANASQTAFSNTYNF